MKMGLLLIPFVFFLVGFYGASRLVRQARFPVPSLVGLSLADAVSVLSGQQLNARIRALKEVGDLVPGTVVEQMPQAGQQVKTHQSIFLVVVCQPKKPVIPSFIGSELTAAQRCADEERLRLKIELVADLAPRGTVIAQWPQPGKELEGKQVTVYISRGEMTSVRLVPDFRGLLLEDVVQKLSQEGIKTVQFINGPGTVITAQKPLPGSLIDVSKALSVQLQA